MQDAFLHTAMERYGPAVYRLALCRLQNRADAEDVCQEVFLRLLRRGDPAWEAEHLKAWLLRTALQRCADVKRRWLRHPVLPLEEIAGQAAEEDAEAGALWEAVAALPAPMRMTVHLYYAEGYRTEEIAAMMGCPAATVRTRLRRAREKLKGLLEGDAYGESLWEADGTCPDAGGT